MKTRTPTIAIVGICVAALPLWAAQPDTTALAYLDHVDFGQSGSENSHALTAEVSPTGTGLLDETFRRIGADGRLSFTMRCDPRRQTYLTVKLSGSEYGRGQIYLYDGDERIGRYLSDWPELDLMTSAPAFPGRFYYSTYMIPRDMTRDRQSVTLTLRAVGHPRPYSPEQRDAELEGYSRGIYRAYTHVQPFLVPADEEPQGEVPQPAAVLRGPEGATQLSYLRAQADLGVRTLMNWQKFGDEWNDLLSEGLVPAVVTGGIPPRGAQSLDWNKQQWLDGVSSRQMRDNLRTMRALAAFARAYHTQWSRFHTKQRMIDRVAAGLDYHRRAQAANGGFVDIWSYKWVGGPNRRKAGGCLEGFGHRGLAEAFLLANEQLQARGMLDEPIDDDANPDTPQVPRRRAYVALFEGSRDYLVSDIGRGHAPNQDMADILAAYLANKCLRILAPHKAWAETKALEYVYSAVGLRPDIYGGQWVSAEGLPMEPHGSLNGGYCGNYGPSCVGLMCRLAQVTEDEQVNERALKASHAFAKFRYPAMDERGRACWRKEGIISWRNNHTPGRIGYGLYPHPALQLHDPAATRAAELYIKHRRAYDIDLSRVDAHYVTRVERAMALGNCLDELQALPRTTYRLPMEPEAPDFAWADETAGAVVVRHNATRLYASLHWRHGFDGKRRREDVHLNNIARIHYTTATIDRIANVAMTTRDGFQGFYRCRYGPYLIGMNASSDREYHIDVPNGADSVKDLVAGKAFTSTEDIAVPPLTTRILLLPRDAPMS